ncbi:MAG: DUF5106 domain-containing protein [Odoribacter sp.]|nr:DUF5106 domain-containing protein [Odoribacter sp.]MDY3033705.1 DUF5106 domain-containing protein [Odoribacter sp.]
MKYVLILLCGMLLVSAVEGQEKFRLPEVPMVLTDPAARADFLALNYWQYFRFEDAEMMRQPELTEQALANFIEILPYAPQRNKAVKQMLASAEKGGREMLDYFLTLYEKYLYDPNSPLRNSELYIPVLEYIQVSKALTSEEKERPAQLLRLARKNRPGRKAEDFVYTLADGRNGRLSQVKAEFTILFFNAPDCDECRRVHDCLASVGQFYDWIAGGRLAILSVYPDADLVMWRAAWHPKEWISGYDAGQVITKEEVYDLVASPTLYLLDKDKNVILKDATLEQILEYFQLN